MVKTYSQCCGYKEIFKPEFIQISFIVTIDNPYNCNPDSGTESCADGH